MQTMYDFPSHCGVDGYMSLGGVYSMEQNGTERKKYKTRNKSV